MTSALLNYKLFRPGQPIRLYLLALIAAFTLAGCGSQDETAPETTQQVISFKIPDTIQGSKLDLTTGVLTATLTITNIASGISSTQLMDVSSGTEATAAISGITLGDTSFTVEFTYELAPFGPLVVASDTQIINVVEGTNPTLTFVLANFDTSFDEDGDGISNLVELDEFSITSPVVALCILDTTAVLDDCELGS